MHLYQFLLVKCSAGSLPFRCIIESLEDVHLVKSQADSYKNVFQQAIKEKNLVEVGDPMQDNFLDGFVLCKPTLNKSIELRLALVRSSYHEMTKIDRDFIMASLHGINLVILEFNQSRDLFRDVRYIGNPFFGRCEFGTKQIEDISIRLKSQFKESLESLKPISYELRAMIRSAFLAKDQKTYLLLNSSLTSLETYLDQMTRQKNEMLLSLGKPQKPPPPKRTVSISESTYLTMVPSFSRKRDGVVMSQSEFDQSMNEYDIPKSIQSEPIYQKMN